jgi:hypothetical protein
MTTRVGVARSKNRHSAAAGREAATAALASLEGDAPSLVIVFATAGHDQQAMLDGVADVTGRDRIVGCSAEGVITQQGSDESSHAVAVVAISSDAMVAETFFIPGFAEDGAGTGRALAEQIRARGARGSLLVLFPDGIRGNCTELVRAIDGEFPGAFTIVGGTAGDLLTFQRTFQFERGVAHSGGVAAVLIDGLSPEIAVTHGCDLIGTERTVTRAEGDLVYEIDGEPAWSFFKEYLAEARDTLEAMHLSHLLLAERLPEAAPGVDDFTVRVPMKLDAAQGALYFAAGIRSGSKVQLARRNAEKVCQRAVEAARDIASRRKGERPLLVLELDCAGRGAMLFGKDTTSRLIEPVQQVFGKDVPWIGLHTYGEIAPVHGRTVFHNYTAVLCALYASPRT